MKIFGKAEKMPETLAELKELCPDLVAQAIEEGKQGIDIEALRTEAATEEQTKATQKIDHIYAVIGAAISEDIAQQIMVIVDSGVTIEQFKTIGKTISIPGSDSDKELKLKSELLDELKKSGAENPGHDTSGPRSEQWNKDANALAENQEKINVAITEYQKEHPEASYRDAALAVAKAHPEIFRNR